MIMEKRASKNGGETWFIKLPYSVRRPIAGGCQCSYCKAHLHQVPQWDTLAIDPSRARDHAWTVHYPELAE
jgi:hypothetical protein